MEHLTGLAPLVPRYRGFIVDLWGVVHDGIRPYPGAVDGLRRLQEAGKRVVLLSNAPRVATVAQAAMREMGINDVSARKRSRRWSRPRSPGGRLA